MAKILAPFWKYLFDTFGIFGIVIAMGIVTLLVVIALVLIAGVVVLLKKIIKPSSNAQQQKTSSVTYASTQHSKSLEMPENDAPAQKSTGYEPNSLQDFLERAQSGEAYAQCCCGSMYEHGSSDIRDINKAIYWYTKAADQGHILSNYRLGMIYFEGKYTEVNLELAKEHLTFAAEAEYDSAQYQLARLYSKKNEILCKEMGYTTAQQRTSDAQYNENKQQYKYWLQKAADNGNLDAEYILY